MRFPDLNRIHIRLLGLLGATIAGLVLVVAGVWNYSIEPALRADVAKSQREVALHAADLIGNYIDERITELRATAQIGHLWEGTYEHRKASLHQLMKLVPAVRQLSIIDPDGREVMRLSRTRTFSQADLRNFSKDDAFRLPMRGEIYIGPVYHEVTAEPFVTLGVPIEPSVVEIRGALVAEVNLKTLWNVVSHIKVGRNGLLYVVSSSGQLIAHPDYSRVVAGTNLAEITEVKHFLHDPQNDLGFGDIEPGYDAPRVMTVHAVVPKPHWAVIVEESIDTAFEKADRLKLLAAVILGLAVIAGLFVSFHFGRRIAEPIAQLEKGAERLAQGDLDHILDIRTGDEIERLAEKFNHMAAALKESRANLEAKIAERTKELSSLYAAIAPLKPADSLEQMLGSILVRLCEATGADAALFRLWDKKRNAYMTPAAIGFADRVAGTLESPGRLPAVDQVFRTGEAAIIEDLATDQRITRKKLLAANFRSGAFLPLRVGSEIIGVAQLVSRTQGFFRQEKEAHLMAVARQMSIALENRDLYERAQRNLERVRALHEIDLAITSTLDLSRRLDVLLEKIEMFIPIAAASTVRLFDCDSGRMEALACRGLDKEKWRAQARTRLHGRAETIVKTRAPLIVRDIRTGPQNETPEIFLESGLISFLGVPLLAHGEVLGVLSLFTAEEHDFSDEEVEFFTTLAGQAAIAIRDARLYERAKKLADQLSERERIQRTLKELSQDITAMEVDKLLEKLTMKIRQLFNVEVADVRFLGKRRWERILVSTAEKTEWLPEGAEFGEGANLWVVEQRRPMAIRDYTQHRQFKPGRVARRYGIRGYLAAPLIGRQGQALGVVRALSKEPREFSRQEIELFEQLANGAAIAIENSRLYRELQLSNNVKDEFLSVISHELRTPLSVITGYASLLAEEALGKNSPEQAKGLRVIKERAEDLSDLIGIVLEAAKLTSGAASVKVEGVDLAGLMSAVRDTYRFHAKSDRVELVWDFGPNLPFVLTDGAKLKRILGNLIDNALKFTEQGTVTVAAKRVSRRSPSHPEARRVNPESSRMDPIAPKSNHEPRDTSSESRYTEDGIREFVEFSVSDTGIGITHEMIPLIFEKFRQGDSRDNRAYEGAGLGLYIVKKFTELLGGEVRVESEPGRGSTFRVTLSCRPAPLHDPAPVGAAELPTA